MARRKKEITLADLAESLSSGLVKAATRPDANGYIPHAKQERFHKSEAKGRLYIGGNRSGKTVGGIIEDIWWLQGKHPYRETPPPPVRGRLVCVDFPNGFEKIIKPTLTQWIPPSALINGSWVDSYNNRTRTLTLANGSFLEIMSYEQETDNFAGASRHFTHFDEECPKTIFTECKARLIDTGGSWWMTMTPVEGMTWVYDDIWEPVIITKAESKIDIITVDMTENTYLSEVEVEDFLSGLDENDKLARKAGRFVSIGGLVFKGFNPERHLISSFKGPLPQGWRLMGSIDHGFNNPTSVHWHIVSPDNQVITIREHYRSEWTVTQHVRAIKEIEATLQPRHEDILYYCDPAMRQRNPINGNSIINEYRRAGVNLIPSNNDVKIGIARMQDYQMGGRWFITEDNPKLIWEMRRYRWKTRESKKLQEKHGNYDEPHKKDDHAMDDCRYFFVSRPELPPVAEIKDLSQIKSQIQAMLNGKHPHDAYRGAIDLNLLRNPNTQPKETYAHIDENLGGIWQRA